MRNENRKSLREICGITGCITERTFGTKYTIKMDNNNNCVRMQLCNNNNAIKMDCSQNTFNCPPLLPFSICVPATEVILSAYLFQVSCRYNTSLHIPVPSYKSIFVMSAISLWKCMFHSHIKLMVWLLSYICWNLQFFMTILLLFHGSLLQHICFLGSLSLSPSYFLPSLIFLPR